MGEPIKIDFGTQSDPGRYGPDAGPRHINAFVERTEEGKPSFPIYCTPGLTRFATVTSGGHCRGMIVVDDTELLVLSGNVLASIDAAGSSTTVGTITGNKNSFMARNAAATPQVAIVMDGQAFVYSAGTVSAISDADLPNPNSVFFLDQRVIYTIPDGRLFWSDIDDVTAIDALSFSTAEGAPDGLVRGFGHRLDGWLFGRESIEIWRSTANADQPFLRASGGFIPIGCSAPFSVAAVDDAICWVGHNDIPYIAQGYSPQPLIHGPVCRDIRDTADKTTIYGWSYYEGGYGFWQIHTDDWTWVLNLATLKWFEKQSYGETWSKGHFGVRFNGKTIFGEHDGANLYQLDSSVFDEDGRHLVWSVSSPPMHAYPNRISVDRLYLDMITGEGLNATSGHESDPQVMLRWSDDGRRTWSRTISKSLGAQGSYGTRVVFNNLGTTGRQGRVWEVSVSSPVIRGLLDAAVEGDPVGT